MPHNTQLSVDIYSSYFYLLSSDLCRVFLHSISYNEVISTTFNTLHLYMCNKKYFSSKTYHLVPFFFFNS